MEKFLRSTHLEQTTGGGANSLFRIPDNDVCCQAIGCGENSASGRDEGQCGSRSLKQEEYGL